MLKMSGTMGPDLPGEPVVGTEHKSGINGEVRLHKRHLGMVHAQMFARQSRMAKGLPPRVMKFPSFGPWIYENT